MPTRPNPTPAAAGELASVTTPAQRPAAAAPVVSRFGEISPAFAATFGASVSVGLMLGARTAEARELADSARRPRVCARGPALPTEIATDRALPPSRVQAALVTRPRG
jgi:hypothetical protein